MYSASAHLYAANNPLLASPVAMAAEEQDAAMSSEPVSAIVIAGGRSRRLGFDKRRLKLWGDAGPTLLEHTVALVGSLCSEVVVVLNDAEQWPGLPARMIPDAFPEAGALGGLATGLGAASSPYALAVASDMPLLNPRLLRAMLEQPHDYDALVARLLATGHDSRVGSWPAQAAQPTHTSATPGQPAPDAQPRKQAHEQPASQQGGPHPQLRGGRTRNALNVEPLHAIYSRACLVPMHEQIAAGNYQIVGFFATIRVRYLGPALLNAHDPQGHSFLSINTPEQLDQVRHLLNATDRSA